MEEEMTKERILEDVEKKGVQFVDLLFVDIMGTAKNCEITVDRLADVLDDGLWFDGSSIEGFVRISESDMFLKPDLKTYVTLPWTEHKVARIMCDVQTDEKKPFEGDPRYVLKKQMKRAEEMGFKYKVGPELEFFFFKRNGGKLCTDVHDNAGYFDLDPLDLATDLRREIVPTLNEMGLKVEMSHHEVAPGQHEIDFTYGDATAIADRVLTYKNVVKTMAMKYGLFASFMPKPVYGVNGSGMHVHQSLWKGEDTAFFDEKGEYGLTETAKHFIAGQLEHARALSAVVAPTVNSYKRLVPGYEAPVYVCWAKTNRSALIRIPRYQEGKERATRAELRCPDPSCNPYLAFAAMLAAGLDGIENKKTPPEPVEESLYTMSEENRNKRGIPMLPASLGEATSELEKDGVLRKALGEHVSEKLIEAQKIQWDAYRLQVTPWEIERYLPVL